MSAGWINREALRVLQAKMLYIVADQRLRIDIAVRGTIEIKLWTGLKRAELEQRGEHYDEIEGAAATNAAAAASRAKSAAEKFEWSKTHPNAGRSNKPSYVTPKQQQEAKALAFSEVAKDPKYSKYIKMTTKGKNTSFDINLDVEDPGAVRRFFGSSPTLSPEEKQKLLAEIKAKVEARTDEILNKKRTPVDEDYGFDVPESDYDEEDEADY